MSSTATRSSRGGKSGKTSERKPARKPAAGAKHVPAKPVRVRKAATAETRPRTKPAPREVRGETKQKRMTNVEKSKKSAKAESHKADVKPKSPRSGKAAGEAKSVRGRSAKGRKAAGEPLVPFPLPAEPDDEGDVVEEYLEEGLPIEEEETVIPEAMELDPIGLPLELLDPELVDVPRPTPPPRPKPKPPKAERRMQVCAGCGGSFTWVSVDGFCFTCLKKKLAQRKRDDDTISSFTPEPEDDDES